MKFVIALLLATTSAIKLQQKDAPAPGNADLIFAGSFSDSPVSAGFVQINNQDPAAELGGAPAAAKAPAADAKAPAADAKAPAADAKAPAADAKAPAADAKAPAAAEAKLPAAVAKLAKEPLVEAP